MEENRVFEYEQGFSLCLRVRERLQDLYEGYLDAMVAETIRAHLNSCFQCNQEYRDLEQTIRLIETLPYAEPVRDFTPAIMTAIRGQSGYSFQAPVVEVETESVVSRPQSIIKAYKRQKRSDFGFLKGGDTEALTVRERAVGVFTLVAAFLAMVFGPLLPAAAIAGGYGQMSHSASQIPVVGALAAFIIRTLASVAESVASFLGFLTQVPMPAVALGGAFIVALLFDRATRRREGFVLAGR